MAGINETQNDVNLLRQKLYIITERNAKRMTGDQVIRILKTISEELYAANIDEALRMTERDIANWDNIASAWDLTWLTLFAYKLHQAQCRIKTKRSRVRKSHRSRSSAMSKRSSKTN